MALPSVVRRFEFTPPIESAGVRVAGLAGGEVPKDVPRLLLPALILTDGWELTHEHLEQLAGTWEETVLADAVHRLDDGRRRSLAEVLWIFASDAVGGGMANSAGIVMSSGMSIVAGSTGTAASRVTNPAPVAERIVYLQSRHAALLRFVLSNLPMAIVEETARIAGTHRRLRSGNQYTPSDPHALRHLSFEQRAAAVRWRLSTEVRFDEVRELVHGLDGDDLDVLLDVVRAADRNVAAEFAGRVWRVLPERAEAEGRRAFEDRLAAAEAWFRTAPRVRIGALSEMVNAGGEARAIEPAESRRTHGSRSQRRSGQLVASRRGRAPYSRSRGSISSTRRRPRPIGGWRC